MQLQQVDEEVSLTLYERSLQFRQGGVDVAEEGIARLLPPAMQGGVRDRGFGAQLPGGKPDQLGSTKRLIHAMEIFHTWDG